MSDESSQDTASVDQHFLSAAGQAVAAWGLEPAAITMLSLSENAVCDVELPDGRHLVLRLHRPGYNTVAELESEVAMVRAMADAGLKVPLPIPTLGGDYYIAVPVGDEVRQVGLIEWVDGDSLGTPLGTVNPDVLNSYRQVGEMAARIRVLSSSWTPPAGFIRRRWDAEGLMGQDPIWGRFWEAKDLDLPRRSLLATARERLFEELSSLSTDEDRFGLVHADLHLGNLMADGDRLTVIDFDDAGYGWFAHELAVSLHPVVDEAIFNQARRSIIAGYQQIHPLDDQEIELIDVFLTVRCLMLIGWLDARQELPAYRHFESLATTAAAAAERYLS